MLCRSCAASFRVIVIRIVASPSPSVGAALIQSSACGSVIFHFVSADSFTDVSSTVASTIISCWANDTADSAAFCRTVIVADAVEQRSVTVAERKAPSSFFSTDMSTVPPALTALHHAASVSAVHEPEAVTSMLRLAFSPEKVICVCSAEISGADSVSFDAQDKVSAIKKTAVNILSNTFDMTFYSVMRILTISGK